MKPDFAEPNAPGSPTAPPWFVAIPFFILGFLFSLWYLEAYFLGDVVHYTDFYNSLYQMPVQHWRDLQRMHLGSSEPLYGYILALGAYFGVDRILYISGWNGVLIAAIGYTLIKYRCSFAFCILVLTNYYLLALLGSAERLKFAYILLVLAFLVESRNIKFLLAAASPFIHTQAMVQFASGFGYYFGANFRNFARTPLRSILILVLSMFLVGGILYVFFNSVGQSVEDKSSFYASESSGLTEAIQWAMLLVAGTFLFNQRMAYFIGMIPMGILTILFGNRVNVATLALFAGLAMLQRKTQNPIVLLVMAYMSLKSVPFVLDVMEHGTGYL